MTDEIRGIGKQIKWLLEQRLAVFGKALPDRQLAQELNRRLGRTPAISGATIGKWANGKGFPDPKALVEMARIGGITVEALVYQEGEPDSVAEPASAGDAPPSTYLGRAARAVNVAEETAARTNLQSDRDRAAALHVELHAAIRRTWPKATDAEVYRRAYSILVYDRTHPWQAGMEAETAG